MDSGQVQKPMNARDLTAEIDRETDEAVFGRQNFDGFQENGNEDINISDVQAQNLGRGAILSQPERGAVAAEVELSEAENAVENPEEFVGVDTQEQQKLYKAEDAEAVQNESGTGNPLAVKVTKRTEAGVTGAVAKEVDELLGKRSFQLADLASLYSQGSEMMREDAYGRHLGDRN